jgi:uncharacterized protein YkwD
MAKIKSTHKNKKNHHKHKPRGVSRHAFEKVYWPYLPLVLLLSALLIFGGQNRLLQAAATRHPFGKVLDYATSMSTNQLLADTNAQRSANGVGSLQMDSKLAAAAQAKATDMATRNYWSHYTPEGNPPWVFVTAQGYSYQKLGENLAAGFDNEQATINGWMASPPHRENLLDGNYTEVGFGFANIADYTAAGGGAMTIVVAFYGQPTVAAAPLPPVSPKVTTSHPVATVQAESDTKPTEQLPTPTSPATEPVAGPLTSQNLTPKAQTQTIKTSNAQLVSATTPFANYASISAALGLLLSCAYWIGRHLRMAHRAIVYSEKMVLKHPLFDVGLIVLVMVFYLLTQTAGLIR